MSNEYIFASRILSIIVSFSSVPILKFSASLEISGLKNPEILVNPSQILDTGFPNGTLEGDLLLDLDQIIGGYDNIDNGWMMLMECLAAGRGICLPATPSPV